MDRTAHMLTAALMAIATVIVLGPGASSVLAQHAAKHAFAAVRLKPLSPVRKSQRMVTWAEGRISMPLPSPAVTFTFCSTTS